MEFVKTCVWGHCSGVKPSTLEKLLGSKLTRTRRQEEKKARPDASEGRAEMKVVTQVLVCRFTKVTKKVFVVMGEEKQFYPLLKSTDNVQPARWLRE